MFIFQGCKFTSMNCLVGVHGFQSIIHPTCEIELKSEKPNTTTGGQCYDNQCSLAVGFNPLNKVLVKLDHLPKQRYPPVNKHSNGKSPS